MEVNSDLSEVTGGLAPVALTTAVDWSCTAVTVGGGLEGEVEGCLEGEVEGCLEGEL